MKLIYALVFLPFVLLGKGVDFPWTELGMTAEFNAKPVIQDRLEYSFTTDGITGSSGAMLYFQSYNIHLKGFAGKGEVFEGKASNGGGKTTIALAGLTSSDIEYSYFTDFPAGTYNAYFERINEGSFGFTLTFFNLNAKYFGYINSITIPTWCRYITCGTKVATNCTSLTFVGRNRLEAKGMLRNEAGTTFYTEQFVTQFPNAICHCTDGDFTPQQLVQ